MRSRIRRVRLSILSAPLRIVLAEEIHFLIFFVALLPRIAALALKPCISHSLTFRFTELGVEVLNYQDYH
jgi:hypothetical protein